MKYILLSIILVYSTLLFSQKVAIEAEKYPFSMIYEWQGRGSILVNKDPSGLLREVNLTLINSDGISKWQESFSPKVNEPFLILSYESKYLYYLDYMQPKNGKIYFHQINQNGSVKSSSISLLSMFKKLGYSSVEDLELVNAINTKESLVFMFEHKNKKEKSIEQILVFMMHNNRLTYAVKHASVSLENLENNTDGVLTYAGSTEERIYFTSNFQNSLQKGQRLIEYTPKGELVGDRSYQAPKEQLQSFTPYKFSVEGTKYIASKDEHEKNGQLVFWNHKVYFIGITKTENQVNLYGYNTNNEIELLQSLGTISLEKKETPELGWNMEEKELVIASVVKKGSKIYAIKEKGEAKKVFNQLEPEKVALNPSILKANQQGLDFVHLIDDEIYSFDKNQLNKVGKVYFVK